ncbi:MAG: ComF family protein, partial [Bacteroidetes bacterium]|nr:ComF family protein [Bacteroidota bacterium]
MGLFSDFAHLLYPNLCISCGASLLSQEELICLTCIHDKLTKTNFHLVKGNPVEKLLHGRCRVEKASAFYYFGKAGVVQNLLHQIKYKGVKEAAEKVGKLYGYALKDTNAFSTADYIIPVPLHKKKERKRGFNQSEYFGNGLSETLEIPMMTENLIRTKETETQTKKSRYNRYENVA